MYLYHIHPKGIEDNKWEEGKEFFVSDNFTNRLGMIVNNFNCWTSTKGITNAVDEINKLLKFKGYPPFTDTINLVELIYYLIENKVDQETQKNVLERVKKLTEDASIFKREMAMENFRKEHSISAPSRQNCIYATDKEGYKYWSYIIPASNRNKISEIFVIDVIDEPFKTSEILIPNESLDYEEMYNNSYKYWNPNFNELSQCDKVKNEYLVKGKIKVLEKICEINPKDYF